MVSFLTFSRALKLRGTERSLSSVTRSQGDLSEVLSQLLGFILLPLCPGPIDQVLWVLLVALSQVCLLLPIATAAALAEPASHLAHHGHLTQCCSERLLVWPRCVLGQSANIWKTVLM